MVYNGYYKVMSNIPKMGQLPTPEHCWVNIQMNKSWKRSSFELEMVSYMDLI